MRALCTAPLRRYRASVPPVVFRNAVEHATHGIAISDDLARFRFANPAFLEIWGYTSMEDVQNRWLFEFLAHPQESAGILSAIRANGSWTGQIEARRNDGSTFPVEAAARAIDERCGKAGWAHWNFTPPEASVEPESEELRRMECVSFAAAGLAHDLNNLLTVINGNSDMAATRCGEPCPSRGLMLEVLDTGQHAAEITRQFLALSRGQNLPPQTVSPNSIVENARGLLARIAGEQMQIRTSLAPDAAMISINPVELTQVLLNLVLNARDATPEGGTIKIETANKPVEPGSAYEKLGFSPGAYVMLSVTDTGSGMTAATRSRAFEPNFTSKPAGQGFGLGLSIVSSILQKSGGHVLVDTQPGAGTTFCLYFPAVPA
jgi:two-component system cell cycle sensor histidine kinase/response regulator CckA